MKKINRPGGKLASALRKNTKKLLPLRMISCLLKTSSYSQIIKC